MAQALFAARHVCKNNCGVRVNALITALIPAVDQAQRVLPSLHDYLPQNVYGYGFIILAVANIILHIRIDPPPPPPPGAEDKPTLNQ